MFQKAVSKAELKEGEIWGGRVGPYYVAIYLMNGEVFATEGLCTHEDCMIWEGWIVGDEVECSCHGGRFDIRTGAVTAPPATLPLAAFNVEERDGDVYVDID